MTGIDTGLGNWTDAFASIKNHLVIYQLDYVGSAGQIKSLSSLRRAYSSNRRSYVSMMLPGVPIIFKTCSFVHTELNGIDF